MTIETEEKKVDCSYPKCKTAPITAHRIVLTNEKDAGVELPFCQYHQYVVLGDHFRAEKVGEGGVAGDFTLKGPFFAVEVAEQVMAAREMTKKEKE